MYAFSIGTAFIITALIFIILKLAVTGGLGLNGLSGRITQFSRFLRQTFRGTENLFQPKSHKSQDVLSFSTLTFRTNDINHSHSTCEYVTIG